MEVCADPDRACFGCGIRIFAVEESGIRLAQSDGEEASYHGGAIGQREYSASYGIGACADIDSCGFADCGVYNSVCNT